MSSRIGPISPVGAVAPVWTAARGLPNAVPPPPLPAPAVTAPPTTGPGLLASMAPSLPPGWDAALRLSTASLAGQATAEPARQPNDADAGALLPRATLPPPEAVLLRAGAAAPAAALAAAWRAQLLTTAPQRRFPVPGASPADAGASEAALLPWSTLSFPLLGAATTAPAPAAPPAPERPGWLVQAWDGRPLVLRLVEPEPEEPPATGPARGLPALRLAVELPRLGRLVVQLQLAPGGVWLAMAVEQEAALPWVQAALPVLTQALSQAGLRLLRWRLERGSGHGSAFMNLPLQLPPSATLLAPALFRAAAEVVLVLQAVDEAADTAGREPAP